MAKELPMHSAWRVAFGAAAVSSFLIAAPAPRPAVAAEAYPARPVRLVVPFPAGGPTDVAGRLFAEKLTAVLGKQVIVDSRPGASSIIGTDIVAKASPDGYTMLFGSTSTFAVNGVLFKKLPYDLQRDLVLVGLASNGAHVLMVRTGAPAKSAAEFVAAAKRQPGQLKYGSSGAGTIIHMSFELFKQQAGIDVAHVPYKGGGPSVIALLGGEVDAVLNDLSVVLPHVKSGRGTALAVAHTSRLAPLPDVPTFAEGGYPGVVASTWFGVAVPAGTPASIRKQLAEAQRQVLNNADYRERLATLAMEPLILSPEQTAAFLKSEIAKWQKIADVAGIRID
jgi:tripartite-type tricarboxylate transporter receptor subunit TctC